jgi:ligand-binding sensor domain-containing protein/two-component sensor histidine kinase
MRRQLCALTASIFVAVTAARTERLPIRAYTAADGLVDERVKCIVPDSRGFLWFCGPDGLSRFDGQAFTTYGVPQGLAYTRINDFLETSRGGYWVATNGGGVYRFTPLLRGPLKHDDGRTGAEERSRFTAFPVGDGPQTNRVNVLHEDRSGWLWAGTDGGLFVLDERSAQPSFRPVALGFPSRPDRAVQVWAFAEDRVGSLWIGTSWGLARRSSDGRIVHTSLLTSQGTDHVRALLIDEENRIWIGHDAGLIVFKPTGTPSLAGLLHASQEPRPHGNVKLPSTSGHAIRFTSADGVSSGMIRALMQSTDGHVWIATWDGMTQFDGRRFRAVTRAQGITKTTALAEDRDGNIWIGTAATGALRLARNGFGAYTEADGLADTYIGAVFENRAGDLYTVSNNRIHRFDGVRFTAVRPNLSKDVAEPVGPGNALQDRHGEWWIPGGAGLYRFPKVGQVDELRRVQPKAIYTTRDGLAGDDVFRLFEDSRGDIWIGRRTPTSFVLTRWERANGTFHRYSDADNLPGFNRTTAFAEDHSGNVWIGFWNGGLARYRSGRFTLLTPADGAPGGGIGWLHVDRRGRLWIASARPGLSRIDSPAADRPRVVPYTTLNGLSGDAVGCIAEDDAGRLYLGLSSGWIDRLDPDTGDIRHYTAADGLSGADLTAAYRDRSGNLWFGTYNGLFRLVPGPDRPLSPPTVLIRSVRVAGESRVASDLGQREIPPFELEPSENQVHIEFFGLGAGVSDGLRYQYRLEGADADWNPPTDQREVNYASLSPGTYRFLVRTVAADDSLSPQPASVVFTILRPIWQRWWFRSAGALGFLLIVLGVHRHRVARLLALERVRMRIAGDLHDDIGGSLSRISIQSEVACREAAAGGDQPVRRLAEIAESARALVDALSDVVWSVDPRKDDVASVLRRIREYADDLLLGSTVRWTYSMSSNLEPVRLDPEARRDLFLLLKEAVTNVARHARARSVSLRVEGTNPELRIQLCDDGRGFDPNAISGEHQLERHGLASMRTRAHRLGARLTIESSPGNGTTLSVHLPLRRSWRRMTMLLPTRLR